MTNYLFSVSGANVNQIGNTEPSPFNSLPVELLRMIFPNLDLETLGAACCVNREWRQLVESDRSLWKNVIYREIAFSNENWAECFGADVIQGETLGEDFDSLPFEDVIGDFRKIQKVFPSKKAREALMLVRIPKTLNGGLTLRSLGLLAKQKEPSLEGDTGYKYIKDATLAELGDRPIDASCWVLMTKDVLPGSRNKSFAKQQVLVAALAQQELSDYQVPEVAKAVACIFAEYFRSHSKTRLFSEERMTYMRCQEFIIGQEAVDDYRVTVGRFAPFGLYVDGDYFDYDEIGVAPLRVWWY